MILVKPSHEILTGIEGDRILRRIERSGRVCYKSEAKVTADSAKAFVAGILKRGHESVIEHENISVRIICDRGVTHEIVRHRLCAYSQESTRYCVSGDTMLIPKNQYWSPLTVADMYKRKCDNRQHRGGKWKRLKIKSVDLKTGELIFAPILDIIHTGIKKVIELKTRLGYSLILTPDHRVLTETGFMNAIDAFDREIAVNGKCVTDGGIDALRKYHWNKGRINTPRKDRVMRRSRFTCHKLVEDKCETCGKPRDESKLYVHHVDEDRDNNDPDNLLTTCSPCHGRVHSKNLEFIYFDRVTSIREIGACSVYDLSMPSRNFVANGIVVHNCNYKGGVTFVIPPWVGLKVGEYQFLNDRPERWPWHEWVWFYSMQRSEANYIDLLESHGSWEGWSPQQARSVLPNSLKTEIVMTANIREWRHILRLRTSKAAHPQMREVMIPILKEFREKIDVLFDDIQPGEEV